MHGVTVTFTMLEAAVQSCKQRLQTAVYGNTQVEKYCLRITLTQELSDFCILNCTLSIPPTWRRRLMFSSTTPSHLMYVADE